MFQVGLHRQQAEREQWTDDGARVVHRAMEAEGPAALPRADRTGDERIARRGAQPLADTIEETEQEHGGPSGREPDQRPGHV